MKCPSWSSLEINRKCLGGGIHAFYVALWSPLSGPSIPFLINKEKFQGTERLTHVNPLFWERRAVYVCGGDGSAKASESGLNTLRPLSLKVCQRVHSGRRPSKSTIMGFNAFHLWRGKGLRVHVLRGSTMYKVMAITRHHKSAKEVKSEMPKPSIKGRDYEKNENVSRDLQSFVPNGYHHTC